MFDSKGRRIAEYNAGTGALIREYVWMGWDPIAVIEGGVVSFVRADHIGRPVYATNASGVKVWTASYNPFGGVTTSTGTVPTARFPGQWFQSESGLHQNWMRDYDPTTGRYLQADPLGLVDGASVYGYVLQNPGRWVDPRGESANLTPQPNSKSGQTQYPETLWCARTSDHCYDRESNERANCFSWYASGEIKHLSACLERTGHRRDLCIRGAAIQPPEWNQGEDNDWDPNDPYIPEEGRQSDKTLPPQLYFFLALLAVLGGMVTN